MNKCVLIVDDDEALRDTVCDVLTDQGYPATSLGNGKDALEWLRANAKPCVILLDLMMPVMNGWDFLREREKDPAIAAIPVVVFSASHATTAQASATLTKPVSLQELVSTISRYC